MIPVGIETSSGEEPHAEWHKATAAECWMLDCRASVWRGPNGITAEDLRYSVIWTEEVEFRIGQYWPRPPELEGVTWKFGHRERCGDQGWVGFSYAAAMDWMQFSELCGDWDENDGPSGGLLDGAECEDWWAPSVIIRGPDYKWVCATAWPKSRSGEGETRFDDWDAIEPLLTQPKGYAGVRGFTQAHAT